MKAATYRAPGIGSTAMLIGGLLAACATPSQPPATRPTPEPCRPGSCVALIDRGPGRSPAVVRQGPRGEWRIARGVLATSGAGADRDTPRTTILGFVEALERRDYVALIAFAPSELRSEITPLALRSQLENDPEGTNALIRLLREHAAGTITVEGARASLRYGGALFEMELDPSERRWVVVDPD